MKHTRNLTRIPQSATDTTSSEWLTILVEILNALTTIFESKEETTAR